MRASPMHASTVWTSDISREGALTESAWDRLEKNNMITTSTLPRLMSPPRAREPLTVSVIRRAGEDEGLQPVVEQEPCRSEAGFLAFSQTFLPKRVDKRNADRCVLTVPARKCVL